MVVYGRGVEVGEGGEGEGKAGQAIHIYIACGEYRTVVDIMGMEMMEEGDVGKDTWGGDDRGLWV